MPPRSSYGGAVTPRDSRRAAVYAAEEQWARQLARGGDIDFFGTTLRIPVERRFADVASVQRYVDAVMGLIGVVTRWPGVPPVRVRERRGSGRAHYADGVIALPLTGVGAERWAARESVVLHELAHHLVAHVHAGVAPHGPQFCADFVALVEAALGPESALLLRAALDGSGVSVAESVR